MGLMTSVRAKARTYRSTTLSRANHSAPLEIGGAGHLGVGLKRKGSAQRWELGFHRPRGYARRILTRAGAEGHHHRKSQGPLREKLDSSAVICCADTIPGMREEIVLGAVIELVTRTQLATDVETHSSNSDSN